MSCDVNANLEHHNTIYVIHFKNAFVFKYLQLCQLLISKSLTHMMGYDATLSVRYALTCQQNLLHAS